MSYSEELQQEMEALCQVLNIWIDNPDRIERLMVVAQTLEGALGTPQISGVTLEMKKSIAETLYKAVHMCIGIVQTSSRLAEEKSPRTDPSNN